MYQTLKRLYDEGKITEENLSIAVTKEYITEQEKQIIINK